MIDRLRLATALTMGLIACGGRVGGESPLSEGPPGGTAPSRQGGERGGRGFRPPPQFSPGPNEGAPQLPRAPVPGEPPSGEASAGEIAPFDPQAPPSDRDLDCEAGASRCNGARVELCSPAGGWLLLDECASAALCDAVRGGCYAGCLSGETRCNGAELQQCNAEGTGFETLYQCVTAARCNAGLGVYGCLSGCAPGETRCSGTQLQRCNADQTGYDLIEECSAGCELGACVVADGGAAPSADPDVVPSEDPGPSTGPDAVPSTDPAVPSDDTNVVPSTDAGVDPGANPSAE